MAKITEQIHIQAAPADVFKLCHDLERRAEWDELVAHAEALSPGPLRQGALLRIDSGTAAGAIYTYDAEIESYRFPNHSALRVIDAAPSSPFVSGKMTWSFDRADGGTRLSVVWEYKPRGILGRLKNALGRGLLTGRAIRRSLQNLKKLAEGH